jgi:hypothetical protein
MNPIEEEIALKWSVYTRASKGHVPEYLLLSRLKHQELKQSLLHRYDGLYHMGMMVLEVVNKSDDFIEVTR